MNKTPLISVIIPIYKVEAYLNECVDSVLGQSYSNLEIILVNDGSPDNCPQMCDAYAAQDPRIKVIHKQNGGLSDARNAGTEVSNGEYVIFLDSDDYWATTKALESLIQVINVNPVVDIIYFRRFAFRENDKKEVYRHSQFDLSQVKDKSKYEILQYLISTDKFPASAHNKLVRREILENIRFEKGIVSEDIDWNFAVTLKAEHLFVVNELIHAYRIRSGSITQTLSSRNIDNLLYIIEKWSQQLSTACPDEKIRGLLLSYCAYQFSIVLGLMYFIQDKSRLSEFISRTKALTGLLNYDTSGKVRKAKSLYRIFGLRLTGRLLGLYIKLK